MDQSIVYINLGVGGMTCDVCVVHVTEALTAAVHATGLYNAFERRRRPALGV